MTYLTDVLKASATTLMKQAGQAVHITGNNGGINFWTYPGLSGTIGLPDYIVYATVQRIAAIQAGYTYLDQQVFPPLSATDRAEGAARDHGLGLHSGLCDHVLMTESELAKERVERFLNDGKAQYLREIESTLYRVMKLPFWLWWRGPQMISEVMGTGPYWSRGTNYDKSPRTAFGYYWFYLVHPSYWWLWRHYKGYD